MDKSQDTDVTAWHSLEAEEVVDRLDTHRHSGLSGDEAQRRLACFDRNLLRSRPPRPAWLRFVL